MRYPFSAVSDLSTLDKFLSGGLLVVQVSSPRVKRGGLQGAAVGESQSPGLCERTVVNGIKVYTGLFF